LKPEKKPINLHLVWFAAALVILTIAAYSSVGSLGFVTLDDPNYIMDNPKVSHGLTWSGVEWAFTTGHASNWHPLTWLSHMLDVELFGVNPGPHHLVNLFFHVINTLLLFVLLQRSTGATGRSALVAVLFALHPLHVESIAWISERKDVLSTLFFMLTIWAYIAYTSKPLLRRYIMVFVLLALGLMAKPMLVTLPFVLLLLDIWPLKRFNLESPEREIAVKLVLEKLPLFVLIIASSVITLLVQREGGAINTLAQAPLDERFSNVLVSYVMYIGKMFWPTGLAALYPIPKSIPLWQPLGAALVLITITFAVFKFSRKYPYLAVGWFWYLGTLVPVIGIIQVGSQAMADRYSYIPLIGLFIIVAWGGYDLLMRGTSKRAPIFITLALVIAGLGAATWVQVQYWSDAKSLWTRVLAVTSNNYRAHVAYGSLLAGENRHNEAAAQFAAAIRIQPNYADAHNKLGVELAAMGRSDEAVSHYREALRNRSDLGMAHTNLGNALVAQGQMEEALSHFERALEMDQDNPLALNSLGSALDDLGRVDEAIGLYRKALLINPNLSAAHNNLAAAFAKKGQLEEAAIEMSAALEIEPNNTNYHYNYAAVVLQQGDTGLALEHLKKALAIDPSNEPARRALEQLENGD
jgi:tetratricopeptide (TPR) repeat protein